MLILEMLGHGWKSNTDYICVSLDVCVYKCLYYMCVYVLYIICIIYIMYYILSDIFYI